MPDERIDRRAAVAVLLGCSARLTAAGLAGCSAAMRGRGGTDDPTLVVDVTQVSPGSALVTRFRNQPVIVLNLDGTVRAFSGLCTHESCELGWNARQRLIRCPCHGSAFDTDGRVKSGPAPAPLPQFPSRVRGGKVFIRVA